MADVANQEHTIRHIHLTRSIALAWLLLVLIIAGCAGGRGTGTAPPAAILTDTLYSVNDPTHLPDRLTIRLRNQRGYLFASARVNGQPAGLFMFDTGSSLTVISTGVAGRLDLPVTGSGKATGVGGIQAFDYRGIESLTFGGLEVKSDRAAAISLHPMSRGIGTSVSGMIGVRELGGLPFTLDYSDNTLTVYRRDAFIPPPGVEPERARFDFVGLPVISAKVGDGHLVWLILDSGADNELTLPRKCLELWPEITSTPGSGAGHSAGVGGSVASTYTWLSSIEMFGLTLRDMPVQFEKAPDSFNRQPRPVGRIGGALLKNFRLTIDPQRRRIWAEWLPDKTAE